MINAVRRKINLSIFQKGEAAIEKSMKLKISKGTADGAAFFMATSAVGPVFLTQTALFTSYYKADFMFAIIISVIIAFIVQINLWRIIGVSGMRGQDIANKVAPGLGYFLAILISLGGLAFNVGNIAGAALGFNILTGTKPAIGALLAGITGSMLFLSKDAGSAMEKSTKILGTSLITLIGYMVIDSHPPVTMLLNKNLEPESFRNLVFPIMTLIGGSIGGYISFSGVHRLIESGITGKSNLKNINRSAYMGVGISSVIRIIFFLAVLGVVYQGIDLNPLNPAASVFKYGVGPVGYRIFGIILFFASLTSVIGSAYTSISFIKTLFPVVERNEKFSMIFFTAFSTLIMAVTGNPVALLLLAGAFNGMIIPIVLAIILLASKNKSVVGKNYKHSEVLTLLGFIVVIILWIGGVESLNHIIAYFF